MWVTVSRASTRFYAAFRADQLWGAGLTPARDVLYRGIRFILGESGDEVSPARAEADLGIAPVRILRARGGPESFPLGEPCRAPHPGE
jgi:hypothetical protein